MPQQNSTHQKLLDVALNAASKASEVARQHRENLGVHVSFKGDRNLVTTADVACEKIIVETILSAFPDHKILAEESAQTLPPEQYGKGTVWVIDPIDGTTNYAHGHFQVGISIGCVIDGITQVGVVAAPFLGEVFTATKGGGAFCNGTRITIRGTSALSDALITTGFPYRRENSANICARIERVIKQCRDLRRLGAASLDMCWVACGRLDAYFEETLQPWDGCAGGLIAREAGAVLDHYAYDSELQRLTHRYPGDLFVDNIIVASPELMTELKAVLDASPNNR
jgi:myo-inositol-1(or 4)-monophosphatase